MICHLVYINFEMYNLAVKLIIQLLLTACVLYLVSKMTSTIYVAKTYIQSVPYTASGAGVALIKWLRPAFIGVSITKEFSINSPSQLKIFTAKIARIQKYNKMKHDTILSH